MQWASRGKRTMTDAGPRYAIYFLPAAHSDLYRFGSAVLGYDCYTGEEVTYPQEFAGDTASWRRFTEEPRRYGFHATLKAPFHLSPACTEIALVDAVQSFAASGHAIPAVAPIIETLSGFAAVLPRHPEASLDALAAHCTTAFDRFRAPMSPQERARRLATPLSQDQIDHLDRWGYPHVFAHFRFHMTLTGRLAVETREATVASLRKCFERLCGYRPIPIDRLALLRQAAPQAAFRVLSYAQLRAVR
jgi:Protein of unknown function (DUF1045)